MIRAPTGMLPTSRFAGVRNFPGVYLLVDLDERPLYVGQSRKLRDRLVQHFILQNSSVTANGLLDLYDILRVYVWYCAPEDIKAFEAAIYIKVAPRWNRETPSWAGPLPNVDLATADLAIDIIDSPLLLAVRREPLERVEAKLFHLLRAVRKAKISGASDAVREALTRHVHELTRLIETEGLNGERRD
jgi:hypothetical protein